MTAKVDHPLDLKLVRTFLAVARHASFTRAAEELRITQPAVSTQVRKLEKALGVRLMELIGNRAHLTPAGEVLVKSGGQLLGDAQRLEDQLRDLAGGSSGWLRVGASSTPGIYLLPRVLARFATALPQVSVSCTLGRTLQIEELLQAGSLDCAVVGGHLASRDLVRERWVDDDIVLVAALEHPLARRARSGTITAADLAGVPFIVHSPGSATRRCLETWLASKRVEPNVAMELPSPDAIKGMVAAGLGIAGLSRFSLGPDPATAGLMILPLTSPALRRRLDIVYHPEKGRCPLVKSFRELAQALAAELRQPPAGAGPHPAGTHGAVTRNMK